jgi:methionyl-tRNA formyltransferase
MMSTSKTVIFFGTDSFSVPALRGLLADGFSVGAVVTKPDSKQGRGQKVTASPVKQIALQHDIPVWQPTKLADIIDDIKALGPVIGVLSSYGKIIPQSVLDLFEPGIINIHPSLLPTYRGPSPIETAILNQDEVTGVSIMLLSADMDAGPLYEQVEVPIFSDEEAPALYETLANEGTAALLHVLPAIMSGQLQPSPQKGEATYTSLLKKSDTLLDPTTMTAQEADAQVRAYLLFPKTKLTLSGRQVIVTKAHVSEVKTGALEVMCKDKRYLVIDELTGPSGRNMSGKDFLNGYAAAG